MYHSHDLVISETYIKTEHRNLERRKIRNDFSVQVRNVLLPLRLKVLRHKEREAQSFYSGFFICPPPTRVSPTTKVSTSKRKPTVFPRGRSHLKSLTFSKSPKILRALPMHDLIRTRQPPFSVSGYCDISEWHVRSACAREHLC